METWNSVVLSDDTKSFAWTGVMKAFKEDNSVPKYAKALLELLIEERREMLDSQQKMVKVIEGMGRKVDSLVSLQLTSNQSSSNQTPANSDSSNELLDSSHGSVHLNTLADPHQSSTVEITTGEPLFYDAFPTSSLRLPKSETRDDEEDEDYEDFAQAALQRLQTSSAKLINNNLSSSSSSGPSSSKRKRPNSSGEINNTPVPPPSIILSTGNCCRFQDCEETFDTAAELEEHVKGHTYRQKHHCPVCGLGIRSETRLRDHMNQHTGERPYVCEHCGKGFTRVDAKNGHTKKCSEKNPSSRPFLDQLLGVLGTSGANDNDDE